RSCLRHGAPGRRGHGGQKPTGRPARQRLLLNKRPAGQAGPPTIWPRHRQRVGSRCTMAHGVEADRLDAVRTGVPWKRGGPYLSERQWGTVREDYSDNGDAWSYFTHDQARSRAYKWGEDGIAGFCDDRARLCFAVTVWNGVDPILKERMFGLTNAEGNHG